MNSEDRDEAVKELFQDFYKNPLNDETVERLRKGLEKFYPEVVWEGKHIEALKELHGKDGNLKDLMDWQVKHGPKDLGKFLSRIEVEKD